jgi:ketosteroid isomerase-like protein
MNIFNRSNRPAVLLTGVLLLCASLVAYADEVEDANQLFKQGQRIQALNKVNAYLADKPKDAQARFLKGLILTEQGKTTEAIKIFSALTDDYPDLPEPYNNLAVLYAGQGQYDKAKLLLEMAISTHPSYATAHENLGDIYAKMASQAYDRALQLDHGNTAMQTKLAMIQNLFAGGTTGTPARHATVISKVEEAAPSKAEESGSGEKASPVVATETQSPRPQSAQSPPGASVSRTDFIPSSSKRADKKDSGQILKTVTAWAAAWSAQNTDQYLSFYAEDFKTPGGATRAAWQAARREHISKPKHIHVDIRNITTQFIDSDHATAKFLQSYRASHLKTSSYKTLLLVKSGNQWLIQEERSK